MALLPALFEGIGEKAQWALLHVLFRAARAALWAILQQHSRSSCWLCADVTGCFRVALA